MRYGVERASWALNSLIIVAILTFAFTNYTEVMAKDLLIKISDEDRYCLQQNVFFEARNQSIKGQVAVAWVTLNRVKNSNFPATICEVVWQSKQFSWTHDGKPDEPAKTDVARRAWEDAGLISEIVLFEWLKGSKGPVGGATFYNADYVMPAWAKEKKWLGIVDNHIFYK